MRGCLCEKIDSVPRRLYSVPRRALLPVAARAVAAGGFHTLALSDPDRAVYGWGSAACGQLGLSCGLPNAAHPFRAKPLLVELAPALAGGRYDSLGALYDGLDAQGVDAHGGEGPSLRGEGPPNGALPGGGLPRGGLPRGGLPKMAQIAAGLHHSLLLSQCGTVYR